MQCTAISSRRTSSRASSSRPNPRLFPAMGDAALVTGAGRILVHPLQSSASFPSHGHSVSLLEVFVARLRKTSAVLRLPCAVSAHHPSAAELPVWPRRPGIPWMLSGGGCWPVVCVAPCARRLVASFCCAGVREGGRPICFPRAMARLRPSAVRLRIRSRSTAGSAASNCSRDDPTAVATFSQFPRGQSAIPYGCSEAAALDCLRGRDHWPLNFIAFEDGRRIFGSRDSCDPNLSPVILFSSTRPVPS